MSKINVKMIRELCRTMCAGWEGVAVDEFNGIRRDDFNHELAAAGALEFEIEELEAQTRAKKDERNDRYRHLEEKRVKIRKGVSGHKDYGDDSPVYGGMGFVRQSERRSGLTVRKKNNQG